MSKKRQVGFFGGTFDPIHFGHLNLAISLLEAEDLDEVWFCPASSNPHKEPEQAVSAAHRLSMVRLAIENVPALKAIDLESKKNGPSYTIDTIRHLVSEYPDIHFRLILSNDVLASFHRWREPEELVRLAPPLVGQRLENDRPIEGSAALQEALKMGLRRTPLFEISATQARQRLQNGLFCGHLVPAKVLDYIAIHQLY